MIKKLFLTLIVTVCLLSGCSSDSDTQEAPAVTPTIPPTVSDTAGKMYETTPPMMEGTVTKITDDKIFLKVQGKEWDLFLSDRAKEEMKIFDEKYDTPIMVGSFIQIKYDRLAHGLIANNLAFVTAN